MYEIQFASKQKNMAMVRNEEFIQHTLNRLFSRRS